MLDKCTPAYFLFTWKILFVKQLIFFLKGNQALFSDQKIVYIEFITY